MQYAPSAENPADAPSRRQSDLDCTLSEEAWSLVQRLFGPHTFDLMSLDSNSLESSGINVFAQQLPVRENLYVFPPFVLIGPLLRFFIDQHYQHPFTIIVPDIQPCRYRWALLQATSIDRFLLGRKGDDLVLFLPSAATPGWFPRPLQ